MAQACIVFKDLFLVVCEYDFVVATLLLLPSLVIFFEVVCPVLGVVALETVVVATIWNKILKDIDKSLNDMMLEYYLIDIRCPQSKSELLKSSFSQRNCHLKIISAPINVEILIIKNVDIFVEMCSNKWFLLGLFNFL